LAVLLLGLAFFGEDRLATLKLCTQTKGCAQR